MQNGDDAYTHMRMHVSHAYFVSPAPHKQLTPHANFRPHKRRTLPMCAVRNTVCLPSKQNTHPIDTQMPAHALWLSISQVQL